MRPYSILESLRRAATNDHPWISTPAEAGVLVAEMERLRVERDHCRKAMEFANAEAERMRGAVERERSAVVAFMRAEMRSLYENGQERPAWFVLERKADAIERGAHRREEAP